MNQNKKKSSVAWTMHVWKLDEEITQIKPDLPRFSRDLGNSLRSTFDYS